MIKAGDVVEHRPSGETWVIAWANAHDVMPCGWPSTHANPDDCVLITACSEEDSISMLRKVADGRHDAPRASRAEHELIRLRVPEYVNKERRSLESAIAGAERQISNWRAQLAELDKP